MNIFAILRKSFLSDESYLLYFKYPLYDEEEIKFTNVNTKVKDCIYINEKTKSTMNKVNSLK